MVIAIDCRMISASGVGVYLRGCIPYFLSSSHRFILLGDPALLAPFAEGRQGVTVAACDVKPFSLRELCAFPRPLLRLIHSADVYYSPYFNIPGGVKVPIYTTIHDIIFPDMPELCSKAGLAARMWFYRRAFRRARMIFTVSEFSRGRIQHFLRGGTAITVTYVGVSPSLLEELTEETQSSRQFILFVGNIKRHKGLAVLLEAFFAAKKAGFSYDLVILGDKDNFRSKDTETLRLLEHAETLGITFAGKMFGKELAGLFHRAALLVQPSLYEGFGMPPLEALVCGTPVILSDIPVFREIYGDFPVTFFEAGNSVDLANKLLSFERGASRTAKIVLTPELRSRYTFEKTAKTILGGLGSC